MDKTRSLFKEQILELLDLSTPPEKALELLSSPCLSPSAYSTKDYEPVVIYIVCIRYMAAKAASVEGIWEDLIRKIFKYSLNFSTRASQVWWQFTHYGRFYHPATKLCRKFIPIKEGPRVSSWLDEVLSTPENCLNPYIRVKLFYMKFKFVIGHDDICLKKLSSTFIYTICEIEPHHLYLSVDENDIRFTASDLYDIIYVLTCFGELQTIISKLIEQFIERNWATANSHVDKFLCNFMKIIGTFAVITGSYSDFRDQVSETRYCFMLLKKGIGSLVNCENHLPGMSPWEQFLHIINLPPFRHYTTEVIRDLTVAITNNRGDLVELMISFRDLFMRDLELCRGTCELPRLLLSRQINGPAPVRQHSLLLERLSKDQDNLKNNNDIDKVIDDLRDLENMWDEENMGP